MNSTRVNDDDIRVNQVLTFSCWLNDADDVINREIRIIQNPFAFYMNK